LNLPPRIYYYREKSAKAGEGMARMFMRRYQPEDCAALAKLFYDTVHSVNAKDYTLPQLVAWAPEKEI